jgi:hypothetical protein
VRSDSPLGNSAAKNCSGTELHNEVIGRAYHFLFDVFFFVVFLFFLSCSLLRIVLLLLFLLFFRSLFLFSRAVVQMCGQFDCTDNPVHAAGQETQCSQSAVNMRTCTCGSYYEIVVYPGPSPARQTTTSIDIVGNESFMQCTGMDDGCISFPFHQYNVVFVFYHSLWISSLSPSD